MKNHNKWLPGFFLVLCIVSQASSVFFMKYAAIKQGVPIYLNSDYYLSLLCLAIQAIAWPIALRKIPLNNAYAVMTLQYPVVFLGGIIFFKYIPNLQELSAIILIFVGNLLVTYGK
mgnify:CR=1 FL=1